MQSLREAHLVARLVLVWFALYLGAAVASPVVAPQGYELVCSSVGMVKLIVADDSAGGAGDAGSGTHSAMDCPLCAPGGVPPSPAMTVRVAPAQPLAYATWPIPAARIAVATAAPLPARGPPPGS